MMQKIFTLLVVVVIATGWWGCNSPKTEQTSEDSLATTSERNHSPSTSNMEQELPSEPITDTLYVVTGTEPFWSLAVGQEQIIYTPADGDTLRFSYNEARTVVARSEEHLKVYDLPNSQKLILRQTACPCSDGMGPTEYPYEALLILKDQILEGCGQTGSSS